MFIIVDLLNDMRTTVKTFWISMLLILTCSISGKAVDFAEISVESVETNKVSATLSSCSSISSNKFKQESSRFADAEYSWVTDVELGIKPVTEVYSSNQQRIRRTIEDNLFLRNIFLMLSSHEDLLVRGRTKQYFSDKYPCYAVIGSDYYIYTLRRILI